MTLTEFTSARGAGFDPSAARASLAQMSLRDLWALTNSPRPVNSAQVRIACALFVATMLVVTAVMYRPGEQAILLLRLGLALYALFGFLAARRLTWNGLRVFAVGVAIFLPLESAYATFLPRDPVFSMALVAMATFFPFAFLLTGIDILLVATALSVFYLTLLLVAPPPGVAASAAAVVLSGSVAAGAAVGIILTISKAGMNASLQWWRRACDRERRLRELNQLAASKADLLEILPRIACGFADSVEAGRCLVFLCGQDGVYRSVACAGVRPDRIAWLTGKVLPAGLAGFLSPVLNAGETLVRNRLLPDEHAAISPEFPDELFGPLFVALPIRVEERIDGAIIVTAPAERPIANDDLLLLQAMAAQVGISIAKARLLEQLQSALNAKSEFVNTMSHELRSPLNVVIGYADILVEGELDPKFVGTRIRDSGLELLQLVDNSLTVARMGTGKLKLNVEEFSLQRLLAEVAEAIRSLPEGRKGIDVEWDIDPGLPRVELDRLKLKEIIQNLISNALKYTDIGKVSVRVGRDGPRLQIDVADTGRGIPAEAQARIFEMFERVESVHDSPPPGIGLGLYIVKNLVDLMDGTIHLVSRPGEGSWFTVRLGLRLDPNAAEKPNTPNPTPRPPTIGYTS